MQKINVFWFRRDLRLVDNAGLWHALNTDLPVLPLFIFDRNILDKLDDPFDRRVSFIHREIVRLSSELEAVGSGFRVEYGFPLEIWEKLTKEYAIEKVFLNHDYEPYAKERDAAVQSLLEKKGIGFHASKDHVIFEKLEIAKDDGNPYTVFTPYSRKWKDTLKSRTVKDHNEVPVSFHLKSFPSETLISNFLFPVTFPMPQLESMGFQKWDGNFPDRSVSQDLIHHYSETRDYPGIAGTSRLGIHFRFGTISIREIARKSLSLSETYLNELIWRDFYAMILDNFPYVINRPFKKQYENIQWRNNEKEFQAWCDGKTGYPIVDAGMRELNQTGYMHNRVRMVTASFLTKHLLINWQWGEAYFAKKLLDFDLASNNGGWQWAAGCGTDAAPYFRIFNPASQMEKFDKDLSYVKKWVPEYGTPVYPKPIVDHKMARERCLKVYQEALQNS